MGVFNENAIIGASGVAGGSGYSIDNSCRFDKSSSAKMTRTINHSTSYTISCWVKRSKLATSLQYVYRFGAEDHMGFGSTDKLQNERYTGIGMTTNRYMRDSSAWYHIVIKASTNNYQMFVNGVEHDSTDGGSRYDNLTNSGTARTSQSFNLGGHESGSTQYFDGYIAEFHFCDGMALDPTSFGESGDYGEWKPIEYADDGATSHGGNGFHLNFSNASALNDDVSGNNNDLTLSNITSHDQMLDTPTNNFCTFNYNDQRVGDAVFSEGNMKRTGVSAYNGGSNGSLHTTNKLYYEIYIVARANNYFMMGFAPDNYRSSNHILTAGSHQPGKSGYHGVTFSPDYGGIIYDGSSLIATASTFSIGDIYMLAFDPATGKFWWGENNVWAGSGNPGAGTNPAATLTNLDHSWTINAAGYSTGNIIVVNTGQDSTFAGNVAAGVYKDENDYGNFKYTVPTGFKALCSKNQPDCAVKPTEHFNTQIWSGNNARTVSTGFQPDLVWFKCRSAGHSHELVDSVRGATKRVRPEDTSDEDTEANGLSSFTSTGYVLGSMDGYNVSGQTYVSWNWKANGSGSSNTEGSINTTSTSANVDAGFSISTYTGNGTAGANIGHGLTKKPNLVIVKRRDANANWPIGSVQQYIDNSTAMTFTNNLWLDTGSAVSSDSTVWNNQSPTASLIYFGTGAYCNANTGTYVAYCWHGVEGYSKIGAYRGNTSADGTFIYTGFKPAFVLIKPINYTDGWKITDNKRDIYNPVLHHVIPDTPAAEVVSSLYIDYLSNGFKMRNADGSYNKDSYTYMYYAIAETPFKNTTAR